jgi:demethylmenaquinone methyltransferase/2-methoxy-6-polyprenyl-1,4-benzoquinol methylase
VRDAEAIAQQQAYYRARAPEYDEWWQRRGQYDRGPEMAVEWDRQVSHLDAELSRFDASGDVLELAGGTGWWTERLARTASTLTVVDGSAETLDLNRRRVRRSDIRYEVADIFEWRPTRVYDVVFFSFWLSHVPRSRFGLFWETVGAALAPGGRVFLIDNRNDPLDPSVRDPYVISYEEDLHRRRLSDGSQWQVVKVMYEPDELGRLLAERGWAARIDGTRWFIFGPATRVDRDLML